MTPADDVMGFRWSFERGSLPGMPAARSMYLQSFNSSHQDLRTIEFYEGVALLRQRFLKYAAALGYTVVHEVKDAVVDVAGEVSAQFEQARKGDPYALATGPAYAWDMIVKLRTTANNPAPRGEVQAASGDNVPAYAWIPVTVPSNSTTMSFDFMLEGDGQEDAFAVAVNGTNVLALETSLIETNVTMNSGMVDVAAWAGQEVELFFGIVGGMSINATITVSGIRFYTELPPALEARAFGNDLVISWPISAEGYALEMSTNAALGAWEAVTNLPVIVDLENTVTNQISGGSRFYRLRR